MSLTLNLLLNGVALGSLIFLIAVGLSLIFGLMGVLNFAHGAVFAWGAYVGLAVYNATGSFLLGILAGTVAGIVIGWIMERLFVRPFYGNHVAQILLTLGLMIILTEGIKMVWGPNLLGFDKPAALTGVVDILSDPFPIYRIFTIGIGLLVLIGVHLLLTRTRYGIIIRAGVQDPEMVQALGINVRRVFSLVFAFGAGLAAFGGVVAGPSFGSLNPDLGMANQLNAFIVIVIGGIGNFPGAALGSLLIGIVQTFMAYYLPDVAMAISVAMMAIVLIWKPEGILGVRR
ncbi:branched-chain amino acid ABC transporter permease [Tumebacillus flagellatus]|uniref:ABC transporter permease n=1 Tax=Tumebacillus flagellatus TaxID=1157490 RepID=A0A074M9L4_9BACL|nr:branched-chain amino acid ABC transporter permease [Tumebacillus flagellatus]KEO82612.1 ABC transporter permease [Tumebacillus flagellatus]